MKKKLLFAAGAALCFACGAGRAQAQSTEPKVAMGAHLVVVTLDDVRTKTLGPGARVAYYFNDYFSLDADLNFFPYDHASAGGEKVQGLFGLKAGKRTEYAGFFVKARPGFMRFAHLNDCPDRTPTSCRAFSETGFAFDLGGVIELYPSRHSFFRIDVGDAMIRLRERTEIEFSVPGGPPRPAGGLLHNFQVSVGAGVRF